jgi:hypothetical protein
MIRIIAVLCSLSSPANCHEQTVTTSDFADVSMQYCLMGAPQLAEWMKQHPGRAPGGLALRDRQTGGEGSLGRKRVSADGCCSAFFEIAALWPACQTRETAYALSSALSIVPLAVFSKAMSSIACLNKCL